MMVLDLAHTAFHEWLSNDSNSQQHGTNTTKPQDHDNIATTLALGVFPDIKMNKQLLIILNSVQMLT